MDITMYLGLEFAELVLQVGEFVGEGLDDGRVPGPEEEVDARSDAHHVRMEASSGALRSCEPAHSLRPPLSTKDYLAIQLQLLSYLAYAVQL
jgi:hypothetical protein